MPERQDNDPIDPLPGMIAALDQALEMAGEMARISRSYYLAYKEEGFSEEQALYLCACIANPPRPPSDDA